MRILDWLSTVRGPNRENTHRTFRSAIENLRLGSIKFKSWKTLSSHCAHLRYQAVLKGRRHDARLGFELLIVTSVWFTWTWSAYYGAGRLNTRALDDLHESMCNKKHKIDANQSHQICDTVDNTSHLEFHCRTFVDAGVPFRTRWAHAQSQLRLYVERMLDVNVPEYAPCFRGRVSCYLPHDALSSFTIPKQNLSLCLPNEDFGKSYKRWNASFDLGYEPLKSQSKVRISSFVPSSKIFVWGP